MVPLDGPKGEVYICAATTPQASIVTLVTTDPVTFVLDAIRDRLGRETCPPDEEIAARTLLKMYAERFSVHGSWRVPKMKDRMLRTLFFALRHARRDRGAACREATYRALDRGIPFVLGGADGGLLVGMAQATVGEVGRVTRTMTWSPCLRDSGRCLVGRLDTAFDIGDIVLVRFVDRFDKAELVLLWGGWVVRSTQPGEWRVERSDGTFEALLQGHIRRLPAGQQNQSGPARNEPSAPAAGAMRMPRSYWRWIQTLEDEWPTATKL